MWYRPDVLQRAVLDSDAKRGILNCSRQWGKSTVAAVKAVHRAYTRPGSSVLVASPSERQSAEFLRKAADFVRRLGFGRAEMETMRCRWPFPTGRGLWDCRGRKGQCAGFRRYRCC